MGSISNVYFKKETLKTLLETVEKKGMKGVGLDISINDNTNDYGQNISMYVSQNKEQREAKQKRFYVANGAVKWTDGTIKVADKKDEFNQAVDKVKTSIDGEVVNDGLPF